MSKKFLILSLAAACWLVCAAPQADAPGVAVSMNGASVVHRTAVRYPSVALQHGVQGTVAVQVKLDSAGEVADAQVLSGPDELRKAVLESVLQWHFTREVAGTTRVIQVAFEASKDKADSTAAFVAGIRQGQFTASGAQSSPGRIKSLRVTGLSDQASAELLASLPVHEGDELNAENMLKMNQAVKAFDEHMTVQMIGMARTASGEAELNLVISAPDAQSAAVASPSVPGRIKVGGNVQSAMIVNKVAPMYPTEAKANRVSGTVHLAVIIAKDGSVQELHVLGGPALLIQAAMDAVKQWMYKPTLLNGNPVEVETTVDINFTLNQ